MIKKRDLDWLALASIGPGPKPFLSSDSALVFHETSGMLKKIIDQEGCN